MRALLLANRFDEGMMTTSTINPVCAVGRLLEPDTVRVVGALHAGRCVFYTHSIDARSAMAHLSLPEAR